MRVFTVHILFGLIASLNLQRRLVNGTDVTTIYEFLTAIYYQDLFQCSGTLYRSDIIITAAHCMDNPFNGYSAFIHLNKFSSKEKITLELQEARVNENFKLKMFYENDIALIKLKKPVPIKHKVLLNNNDVENEQLEYIGWGSIDPYLVPLHEPTILQYAKMKLTNRTYCNEQYRTYVDEAQPIYSSYGITDEEFTSLRQSPIKDGLLCASGYNNPYIFGSHGDSGSPLFMTKGEYTKLVGITSFLKCEASNQTTVCRPTLFTNISHFIDYIQSTIAKWDHQHLEKDNKFLQKKLVL